MTHLAVFIWYYRMSVKQFGGGDRGFGRMFFAGL